MKKLKDFSKPKEEIKQVIKNVIVNEEINNIDNMIY